MQSLIQRSVPPPPKTKLQGDINLYSLEQQRKRRANKKSPGFLWAVRRLWDSTELKRSRENGSGYKETSGKIATGVAKRDTVSTAAAATVTGGVNAGFEPGIEKAAFVDLMLKVHFLIICPPVDRELALRNAALDWSKDNGDDDDETLMTYDRFVDSMFELVRVCNTSVDVVFSWRGFFRVSRPATSKGWCQVALHRHNTNEGTHLKAVFVLLY